MEVAFCKNQKNSLHESPYEFSENYHTAQMMHPIALYNHKKKSLSPFEAKFKNLNSFDTNRGLFWVWFSFRILAPTLFYLYGMLPSCDNIEKSLEVLEQKNSGRKDE